MIAKRAPWATIPVTFDAILMDQSATSRIDPLLIAETTKGMLCNLGFIRLALQMPPIPRTYTSVKTNVSGSAWK
jgi:hypothetical protein